MTTHRTDGTLQTLGEAIDAGRSVLPFVATGATWASEALTVWGEGWSFSTMSSWRLSRGGKLVASVGHEPEAAGPALLGRSLLDVQGRVGTVADDPVLVFDDGLVLEVAVDIPIEPWVFRLPAVTYVPSDIGDSRL